VITGATVTWITEMPGMILAHKQSLKLRIKYNVGKRYKPAGHGSSLYWAGLVTSLSELGWLNFPAIPIRSAHEKSRSIYCFEIWARYV
jgi:hypothetical protein